MENPYFSPTTMPQKPQLNWAQTIGGGLGIFNNAYGMANQSLDLNSQIAPSQQNINEAPVYTAGQAATEAFNADAQNTTGMEAFNGAVQGAGAGAAFGAPGVAIGAVAGFTGSLIGGDIRASKQRDEIRRARKNVNIAQTSYNQQEQDFRSRQNQMSDYYDRVNQQRYNLYR